jgi:hypothetical protein
MIAHQNVSGLAALGRHGDTMLVHMNPHEVAGLQAIAHAQGTSLTVNPHTGMPEAFSLVGFFKSFLPSLLGIGAGILFPEFSPWLIGAAVGGGTALATGSPLQGLMAGIGAGSATGVGSAIKSSFGLAGAPVSTTATGLSAGNGAINNLSSFATDTGAIGGVAGTGAAGIKNIGDFANLAGEGVTPGVVGSTGQVGGSTLSGLGGSAGLSFGNGAKGIDFYGAGVGDMVKGVGTGNTAVETGSGLSGLFDKANKAAGDFSTNLDKFSDKLGGPLSATARVGMPLFSALNKAGAFAPDPIEKDPREKYDPKRSLYLTGDSGLILNPNMEGAQGGLASMKGFKRFDIGGAVGGPVGGALAYTSPDGTHAQQTPAENYGLGRLNNLAQAQSTQTAQATGFAHGGYLNGPGDGMSDSIPASIEGQQPARLADGEFVVPADVVSHIGNGSSKAGAHRLYGMMNKIRKARTGTSKQGRHINPNKFLPA